MPYIPHARMDRVKEADDVFTLKYFSNILNFLGFHEVHVFDPHSSVSVALINHVRIHTPKSIINDVMGEIILKTGSPVSLFFPDEGAMKRYAGMVKAPYAFGVKTRDWKTGEITGLDIVGDLSNNKVVLICDDICSYGGTFFHSAKKLKELGVQKVFLYVSHCENSIERGKFACGEEERSLLETGYVDAVYTTDTLYSRSNPKINVVPLTFSAAKKEE